MLSNTATALIEAAQQLSTEVDALAFAPPTEYIYNPLDYAWAPHQRYLERYGSSTKRVVFLGMNPGPFGMAQCGVPFGEIALVRDWMGINEPVQKPANEHPKRPIEGFDCAKSEVSGRRLWSTFKERFGAADAFFEDQFVANFCPLVFMEAGGKNRTPDRLPAAESAALYAACDAHLRSLVQILEPEWLVGVGAFAQNRAKDALADLDVKIGKVLHPSPASPAANRGWAEQATKQLIEQGIWS